jgi:DNA-binding beta-propeller fold protein YncE
MFRTYLRILNLIVGICLTLAVSGSIRAQKAGYIYVANGVDNSVDVLRASDHIRIASMPTIPGPFGLTATRDGKRVYISTFDGKNIYTFDTETSALISTLQFGSELREITLTPDDKNLYVPDYNENVVHIVSTRDNTLTGDIPGGNPHRWPSAVTASTPTSPTNLGKQ